MVGKVIVVGATGGEPLEPATTSRTGRDLVETRIRSLSGGVCCLRACPGDRVEPHGLINLKGWSGVCDSVVCRTLLLCVLSERDNGQVETGVGYRLEKNSGGLIQV